MAVVQIPDNVVGRIQKLVDNYKHHEEKHFWECTPEERANHISHDVWVVDEWLKAPASPIVDANDRLRVAMKSVRMMLRMLPAYGVPSLQFGPADANAIVEAANEIRRQLDDLTPAELGYGDEDEEEAGCHVIPDLQFFEVNRPWSANQGSAKIDMDDKCDDCRKDFRLTAAGASATIFAAPMLNDEVWLKLADKREMLCFGCLLNRSIERRVDLPITALKPCGLNLFQGPCSYFDLWMSRETELPPNIEEWREANKKSGTRNPMLDKEQEVEMECPT